MVFCFDRNDPSPGTLPRGQTFKDFLERNIFWYTGQLILSKIIKIVATMQLSYFKVKMCQIRFLLQGELQTPQIP